MAKFKVPSKNDRSEMLNYFKYKSTTGQIYWNRSRQNIQVGSEAGSITQHGYRVISFNNTSYMAHRVAWFLYYKIWPEGELDHINGIITDNRIKNLRATNPNKNQHNRNIHRHGRPLGVYPRRGGWEARAPRAYLNHKSDKNLYLGDFETQEAAAKAVIEFCSKKENSNGTF